MKFSKKTLKITIINIFLFGIILLFIEILTGNIIYKSKLDCSYLLCGKEIKYKNPFDFYDEEFILYKRDKYGFRGRVKQVDKIDILTIGGSTTDERYLKNQDTWSQKLESKFNENGHKIDIVNAGIDGQSTFGHIWNFNDWFPKVKNLKAKYIIFYIGLNEKFSNNYRKDNKTNLRGYNFFQNLNYLLKKNQGYLYRLLKNYYVRYYKKDLFNVGHTKRNANYIFTNEKINLSEVKKDLLKDNLSTLAKLSKKYKMIPIFITQKTLRGYKENNNFFSIDEKNYFLLEKEISELIINFCKKNNLKYLDLNKNLHLNKKDFYDLVHTSPQGSEKISKFIYNELKNTLIFDSIK